MPPAMIPARCRWLSSSQRFAATRPHLPSIGAPHPGVSVIAHWSSALSFAGIWLPDWTNAVAWSRAIGQAVATVSNAARSSAASRP